MLIFLIVILGLSFLILSHEAGHFLVGKAFGLKIDEFGFGFPPRIFAWTPRQAQGAHKGEKGETEYSLNWLPFGGFVRIAGENDGMVKDDLAAGLTDEEKKRIFAFQPAWKRAAVMLAGVTVNFLTGWLLLSAVLMIGTPKALVISNVQKGSPAEQIGLMSSDVVKGFTDSQSFIQFVNSNKGKQISITITRNNKDMTFSVVPRVNPPPGEGSIGVELADAGTGRESFFPALWDGIRESVIIVGMTFQAFYQLLVGLVTRATLAPGIVGPVGIFSVAEETGKIGLIYLAQLLALISLNLTVVNLIPFPALDGGRFFMVIIEKIKGSPISRKVESAVNTAGFAFLILLMLALTVRDVSHWF